VFRYVRFSLQFSNGWLIFPLLTFTAKWPLLKPSTAVKMTSLRFVLNPRISLTSQLPWLAVLLYRTGNNYRVGTIIGFTFHVCCICLKEIKVDCSRHADFDR
jgi:hypothetical protein